MAASHLSLRMPLPRAGMGIVMESVAKYMEWAQMEMARFDRHGETSYLAAAQVWATMAVAAATTDVGSRIPREP
jgi:hypothetical protein